MERLWAPWRSTYVTASDRPHGCFLCETPKQTCDDETLLLHRGTNAFVIMNRYPYTTAHLLIAPYEHTADFAALSANTAAEMMSLAQRCVRLLDQEYRPGGYNVGMNLGAVAGAGEADHLHAHVVPRWGGDTNFMPVFADVKVLPETLDQTYVRLRPRFADPA